MPVLTVSMPHTLGKDEATRRLKLKHAEIKDKHTYTVTNLTETWIDPNSMDFAFKVLGFSLTGSVKATDDAVGINVDLPTVAVMMKGTIESEIKKELAQVLS
jgi:predicted nucleotidyltransferase